MTPQIALTLAIVAGALILFGTDRLRVDVVALLVLLTVALTGLVSPEEAFAGFSNPAVITGGLHRFWRHVQNRRRRHHGAIHFAFIR